MTTELSANTTLSHYQQRDPKMFFLKVESKWDNLPSEPQFQDLLSASDSMVDKELN